MKNKTKMSKSEKLCLILAALSVVFLLTALIPSKTREAENSPVTEQISSAETKARELAALVSGYGGIDNDWALWLINAKNPLPYGYLPELSTIGVLDLDNRVAEYALLMVMAARKDRIILSPVSAYRSVERQAENFENTFKNEIFLGRSPEDAFEYTISRIAVPYTSEHNAGLAIDFNMVEDEFDQTDEFLWLSKNAHKFGFIMRYPKESTHITGIVYEPWHYRFVGLYHAERIYNLGITLEEYIGISADDNSVVEAYRNQLVV
ncbi:MAG: M15 family metallopeptidase [Oscillospiraceae bacterium]|nr:M15 family metallopeptidase [Oscillospiraceae bacterium]